MGIGSNPQSPYILYNILKIILKLIKFKIFILYKKLFPNCIIKNEGAFTQCFGISK